MSSSCLLPAHPPPLAARKGLDGLWLALLAVVFYLGSGDNCAYLATDFRGYYASAQIALDHGFASVYDQRLQNAAQDALPLHCPGRPPAPPLLHVSMPYLPAFVLLFLPLTALDFSAAYLLFSLLNLVVLAAYLLRFSTAFGARPTVLRLAAWMVCLPLLSNLSLGQMNVYLVVCLGEFILAFLGGKPLRSGLWLAAMLIKPYVLVLLLAGLVVGRQRRVLAGFAAGLALVLGGSLLLAGVEGLAASLEMAFRFAGPLIETGPAMMNLRALALNLAAVLPGPVAWLIVGVGAAIVAVLTLSHWRPPQPASETGFLLLILLTLCATFALSWHSHFYLLLLLLPLLLVLDGQGRLPTGLLVAWLFAPLGVYLLAYLLQSGLARNLLGLAYLGLNLSLWGWAMRELRQRCRLLPVVS